MADEQVLSEEVAPSPEQAEKPKKKVAMPAVPGKLKIPLLLAMVVILAVSTALVITKVSSSDAATKKEHSKDAKKEKAGKFIQLDPFTVNLAGGTNYLQTAVAFEIKAEGSEELETELKDRKPQINDVIITILSSKAIDDISDTAGREKLKLEIKKAVDSLLSYGKIERVYFTTFIMQ